MKVFILFSVLVVFVSSRFGIEWQSYNTDCSKPFKANYLSGCNVLNISNTIQSHRYSCSPFDKNIFTYTTCRNTDCMETTKFECQKFTENSACNLKQGNVYSIKSCNSGVMNVGEVWKYSDSRCTSNLVEFPTLYVLDTCFDDKKGGSFRFTCGTNLIRQSTFTGSTCQGTPIDQIIATNSSCSATTGGFLKMQYCGPKLYSSSSSLTVSVMVVLTVVITMFGF